VKNLLSDVTALSTERERLAAPDRPRDIVSAIMSTKILTVKVTDKVGKALRVMVKHKIGSVIVVEKGKPVGILTERDVSVRVAKGQNVRNMLLKNVMSKPLVTAPPSMEVWQAVEVMVRKDILRLAVVENEKLVGMVTERDIMRWLVKVAYEPNIPEDLNRLLERRVQAHAMAG
jgi:CBS domain-containing protein